MKTKLLLFAGFFCTGVFTLKTYAQKQFPLINSGDVINEGIKLDGEQRFNSAIAKYAQVGRNDTNYVFALTEKSLSELNGKDYDACISTVRQAFASGKERNPELYINLGSALDNAGKKEEAIKAYDDGIIIYPKNHLLYFNKAITLYDLERYDDAVACLKQTLAINPYHAGSHLLLGTIAASEGKIVEALLSMNAFLLMEPEGDRALSALQYMDALAAGTAEAAKPKGIKLSDGDDFEDIELIIKNKIALSSKYKVKSDFDFPIVKQNQVLFEKLEYNKSDKGFWMQYYVPFFKKVFDEDKFEDYSMYMLLSSTNEKVKTSVKKHISDLKDFNDWQNAAWNDLHDDGTALLNGKKQDVKFYFINGYLQFVGNTQSETQFIPVGDAEVYFDNGALAATGSYTNGKRNGKWTYFNRSGIKTEEDQFAEGKLNGVYHYYYESGVAATEASYADDKLNGELKRFFPSGDMYLLETYKDGMLNGRSANYFRNGQLSNEANYSDGKINGSLVQYYSDGTKMAETTYKDDKRDGRSVEYFRDGSIKSEYNYINDLKEGAFRSFHANGKLAEEGMAKNDFIVGEYKVYFPDGRLNELTTYDESGKLNGITKTYDADDKLFYEWEYTKGEITAYKYYNKDGSILAQNKRKLSKFPFTGYYPCGTKKFEGDYEGSKQNGVWKYYDIYGNVESENNYEDGRLDGISKNFYSNGKIKTIAAYTKGLRDGYFEEYYINGQLQTHGYYKDDVQTDDWYTYYMDGTLESHDYYVNDERSGWQTDYDVIGRISDDGNYMDGFNVYTLAFDSSGSLMDSTNYETHSTRHTEFSYTHKKSFEGDYINAQPNGAFTWYNDQEKIITQGNYINGMRDGNWIWYFDNGKKKSETSYDFGSGTGIWNDYYENGQLSFSRPMYNDDINGEMTRYHENGKLFIKGIYVNGSRNGAFYYYDETGQLMIIKYYTYGVQTGYSYNNTDGKEITVIPVKNGSGIVTAYYQNGRKSVEYTLLNGSLDGKYIEYFSNGNIWEETDYALGYNNGISKKFYLSGKPLLEENYTWGELSGMAKYYAKDGKLKETVSYKSDIKHGILQKYNAGTGKPEKTIVYYDGAIAAEQ